MNEEFYSRVREFYLAEMNDHLTYTGLARRTRDTGLAKLLEHIAAMELEHAGFWKSLLEEAGRPVPQVRPRRIRLVLLGLLLRFVNPLLVISALELGETAAYDAYNEVLQEGHLPAEKQERLRAIIVDELEHEAAFHRRKEAGGFTNIRDFILGMNDGLVEILGAVTGLSAAYAGNPLVVAVSGLVVGVAGALSMGIGAFISVRSQRQVNEGLKHRMRILFSVAPEKAQAEFRNRLDDSGIPPEVSMEVAEKVGRNPKSLIRLLAPETEENEWRSALFTGGAYFLGVFFPVLPYFLSTHSSTALVGSVLFAGLALATVGALISVLSGINMRTKIMEMVVSGFTAAGLAYLFGRLMQGLFGIEF